MTHTKLARFVLPLVQAIIGIEWLKGVYGNLVAGFERSFERLAQFCDVRRA